MLRPEELHIDVALIGFAIDYAKRQQEYIGPQVAPELNVLKQTDKYWIADKSAFEVPDLARAPGGDYPQVEWSYSDDTYACMGFGDSAPVPVEVSENADPMVDPAEDAVAIIVSQMMIAAERRIAAQAFSASVFTQTSALTGTARWDSTAPDPWSNRKTANAAVRATTGHKVNTLVISDPTWEYLRDQSDIRDAIYGDGPKGVPTTDQVARVLGIEKILAGTASYWDGSAFVDIWGKSALWCYIPQSVNENQGRIIVPMRTIVWNVQNKGRYAVDGPHFVRAKKSNIYYVDDYTDEKVTCASAGYLFTTVIS